MNCIFTDAKRERERAKNTFKKCISPPRSNVSDPVGCSFSRFFLFGIMGYEKTRFSLIQSLSLWHDPIFCWTFGIFLFCLQQRDYNREIKLHLHIESNIFWTLLVCACMNVLSIHKNAFEIAKKFYSVFFYKYAFFLVSFVYAVTTLVRNWLQLCYKFPRVNSFTFPIRLFRSRFLLDALCLFWAFSFTFIHSISRRFAQMCIEIWCSRCLNFDSRLVPLFFCFS